MATSLLHLKQNLNFKLQVCVSLNWLCELPSVVIGVSLGFLPDSLLAPKTDNIHYGYTVD